MEHAFEDIEVKENAIVLLEYTLRHRRNRCMIGADSMTAPYIPLEAEIGNVRKALHLICECVPLSTEGSRYCYNLTLSQQGNRLTASRFKIGRAHV